MTEPVPSGSNAAAATTTYTYDPFGNLTQTSAPLGRVTSSTYDANSNKISDTDARGNVTRAIISSIILNSRFIAGVLDDQKERNRSIRIAGFGRGGTRRARYQESALLDISG